MGSSGQKRARKTGRRTAHLPKVGTATENRLEQEGERHAVMGNFGVGGRTPAIWRWVALILIVLFVIGGIVTLVAIN